MVDKQKKAPVVEGKHKIKKIPETDISLKHKTQIKTKKKPQPKIEDKINTPEETQQVEKGDVNAIISKIHKSLPTHFDVYSSVQPMYSGGKILIQNMKTHDEIYSSYNSNVVKSEYDGKFLNNEKQRIIEHRDEEIANFTLTNDGRKIITFTKNYLLRFAQNDDPLKIIWTHKIEPLFPIEMAVSPEDVFVALGCTNGAVRVLNLKKGSTSNEYRFHKGSVLKISWHPVMRKLQIISAGDDQKIILFDVVTNTCLCQIQAHEARITSLSFVANGAYLLSTSADQSAKLWDLAQYKMVQSAKFPIDIESACVLTVGKKEFILLGALDGSFHLSKPESIKDFQTLNLLEGQEILKIMQPCKLSNSFYVITNELHIYVIKATPNQGSLDLKVEQCLLGYNDEVLDVKFEHRRQPFSRPFQIEDESVVVATNSPFLKLIELNSMKVHAWKAHDDIVMCVQYMDGYILSGGKDNMIKLWRVDDQKLPILQAIYKGHTDNIISVAFSPKDLSMIASVSNDQTLKLWDAQKQITRSKKELDIVNEIDQSKRSVKAHEKDTNMVKFAPNQKLIATSSQDRLIKIWNPDNLTLVMTLQGHKRGVWDIQFSPVEKLLASASGDQTIKIWNLVDGQIVHNLEGHQGSVLRVNWLCFGLIIVSSDSNGLLKVWNMKKQTCISTFEKHDGKIWTLDVSPYTQEGKVFLASGGNDSLLYIWQDLTEEQTQEQQQKAHQKQLKIQTFQNLIREKKFREAALLAFESNFTQHFIHAVQQLYEQIEIDNTQLDQIKLLAKELMETAPLQFITLLNQINSASKTCVIAQILFYESFQTVSVLKMSESLTRQEEKNQMTIQLQQLRHTTSKFNSRIIQMKRQSFLVQYLLDKHLIL